MNDALTRAVQAAMLEASERAILPRLCLANDIAFVGPEADMIEALGDKLPEAFLKDRSAFTGRSFDAAALKAAAPVALASWRRLSCSST